MHEVEVTCGGDVSPTAPSSSLHLAVEGSHRNITLRLSDLTNRMVNALAPEVADLIEVATYVYAADLATSRGGLTSRAMGADWRRDFRFVIPVRSPDRWNDRSVREALCGALSFLSEDRFAFDFVQRSTPDSLPAYLDLSGEDALAFEPDEVILFSGGLDSLAGAVAELSTTAKKLVLVSHRPSSKIFEHQKSLVRRLQSKFPGRLMHIPVVANREGPLEVKEFTQRTRSFLYTAFAAAIASLVGLRRVRFYENGIVSMNLPIAEQVLGARATRTTHPLALSLIGTFPSQVLGREFEVDNPFIWRPKSDIVRTIVDAGFGPLIDESVSCSHVHEMSRDHTHCGRCSQCIDRRFAVLSADAEQFDRASRYAVDLLTGEREEGIDRTMAAAFVRSRIEMSQMTDIEFVGRYGAEMALISGSINGLTASESAKEIIALHRRHGDEIVRIMQSSIAEHSEALVRGTLPESSLIMMGLARPAHAAPVPAFDEVETTPRTRTDGGSLGRRTKPTISRAKEALHALYSTGVPPQVDLSNVRLCDAVARWLEAQRRDRVSNDTILRAAGRRK